VSAPPVSQHHRELAQFLRDRFDGHATVSAYRDDQDLRPVPIGTFGPGPARFYSTIGMCDRTFAVGSGYELALCGVHDWLPNALASSVYWLEDRGTDRRPILCEDVVQRNARSAYRHVGFVRAPFVYEAPSGARIRWLLGVPVEGSLAGVTDAGLLAEARKAYPSWLLPDTSDPDPGGRR
jgi:hypothetical protein